MEHVLIKMPGISGTKECIDARNRFVQVSDNIGREFRYFNWKDEYKNLSEKELEKTLKKELATRILSWIIN